VSIACLRLPQTLRLAATAIVPLATLAAPEPVRAQQLLAPIWSGIYAGAHGGANWTTIDSDLGKAVDQQSASFGGHLGINLGLGLIVVGAEADVSIDTASYGITALPTLSGRADIDASGTIRGRIGIPIGPALFYATAGYTWTDVGITLSNGGGATVDRSTSFQGIVYGAGVEAMVLPRISFRLEALRFDYRSSKLDLGSVGQSLQEFDPSSTVVRAGVSFHFN